jgi:hypothetical protein
MSDDKHAEKSAEKAKPDLMGQPPDHPPGAPKPLEDRQDVYPAEQADKPKPKPPEDKPTQR